MALIQPQWVEGAKFSAGDAIVSEPVDALRENIERTYQTRYRTLWGSCPILTASLDEARATVRTSVSSSGGVRVTAYATGAASADVTIETLDGVDSETVTLTWASAGVQVADISEAWITSDTRYRVTVARVSGTIAAVEVCELDGEAEEMAGISTVWADVSTFGNLPTLNLRVGDLCMTTDTGYRWEVQSLGPTVWEIVEVGEVASISALPSSDVREGATATIKGDAWTYASGSWSSPPITISSWASRPLGASAYDGMWGVYSSGGVVRAYRYSSTAEEWVPPVVYAGTVTLRARIDGDVEPENETPVWIDTDSNGGAISTDGTRVTWQANTNDNRTALSVIDHGVSAGKYYWCGYISAANVGGTNPLGVTCRLANGSYTVIIASSTTLTNGWRFCTSLAPPATFITTIAGSAKSAAAERWVEVLMDGTTAWLFVDHEMVSFANVTLFTASAATSFVLGENTPNSRGDLLGRSLKYLTY